MSQRHGGSPDVPTDLGHPKPCVKHTGCATLPRGLTQEENIIHFPSAFSWSAELIVFTEKHPGRETVAVSFLLNWAVSGQVHMIKGAQELTQMKHGFGDDLLSGRAMEDLMLPGRKNSVTMQTGRKSTEHRSG